MKTGFTFGNPGKNVKKEYLYHGITRNCNVQPNPLGYVNKDTRSGPDWVLKFEAYPNTGSTWQLNKTDSWFLTSLFTDTCANVFPDGRKRFYYMAVFYHTTLSGGYGVMTYSNGAICAQSNISGNFGVGMSFSKSLQVWHGGAQIIWLLAPKPPSHVRIWVSSDGNPPDYDPS